MEAATESDSLLGNGKQVKKNKESASQQYEACSWGWLTVLLLGDGVWAYGIYVYVGTKLSVKQTEQCLPESQWFFVSSWVYLCFHVAALIDALVLCSCQHVRNNNFVASSRKRASGLVLLFLLGWHAYGLHLSTTNSHCTQAKVHTFGYVFALTGIGLISILSLWSAAKCVDAYVPPLFFKKLQYRPAVDGLRAFAIVPVVLYHFGLSFPGGFAGVDVFFVISGYLITAIILHNIVSGTFSLAGFYQRRCRRLFPASFLVLTTMLLIANYVLLQEEYEKLSEQIASVLLLGANFYYYKNADSYFSEFGGNYPMLHCWSLAVEEQFYILYPLLLAAIFTLGLSNRATVRIVAVCLTFALLASLVFSILFAPQNKNFAFFLLPARAWEMASGGVAWVLECYMDRIYSTQKCISDKTKDADSRPPPSPCKRVATLVIPEIASCVGLSCITLSYFLYSRLTLFPSYPALLPCLGTCVLLVLAKPNTYVGQLLGSFVPRYVGRISYSWYLWHWPIFVLLLHTSGYEREGLPKDMTMLGIIGSFVAGAISYAVVEPLFRSPPHIDRNTNDIEIDETAKAIVGSDRCQCNAGQWVPARPIKDIQFFISAAIAWVALLLVSLLAAQLGGIVFGPPIVLGPNITSGREKTEWGVLPGGKQKKCLVFMTPDEVDALYDVRASDIHLENVMNSLGWEAHCGYNGHPFYSGGATDSVPGRTPQIVFLGSSHCEQFCPVLEKLAEEYKTPVAFFCESGRIGGFSRDPEFDAMRLAFLDKWASSLRLIVRFDQWGQTAFYPSSDDVAKGAKAYDFQSEMDLLSQRSDVVYFGDTTSFPSESNLNSNTAAKEFVLREWKKSGRNFRFMRSLKEPNPFRANRLAVEANIKELAATHMKSSPKHAIRYINMASYLMKGDDLQAIDEVTGHVIYKDFSHVTVDGALRFESLFRKELFNEVVCPAGTKPVP